MLYLYCGDCANVSDSPLGHLHDLPSFDFDTDCFVSIQSTNIRTHTHACGRVDKANTPTMAHTYTQHTTCLVYNGWRIFYQFSMGLVHTSFLDSIVMYGIRVERKDCLIWKQLDKHRCQEFSMAKRASFGSDTLKNDDQLKFSFAMSYVCPNLFKRILARRIDKQY